MVVQRRAKEGPVNVLKRKIRSDQGKHSALSSALAGLLATQHQQYPSWSYQLHAENLAALVEKKTELGKKPSYRSVSLITEDQPIGLEIVATEAKNVEKPGQMTQE